MMAPFVVAAVTAGVVVVVALEFQVLKLALLARAFHIPDVVGIPAAGSLAD